jgi:PAS domain S-box-containing protein
VIALLAAVGLGVVAARRIVQPVEALARTAQIISDGDLSRQAEVTGQDEIGKLAVAFNQMTGRLREVVSDLEQHVIELERKEKALRKSEERFRALVETTSDWIWETDENGVYTYTSPAVRDMLGYEPDELVGKTPFDLMPPDEAERVTIIFQDGVTSLKPLERLENVNLHKDGHQVVLETSGVPILSADGELLGFRGIDRDITARKRAAEKIHRLNEELEQRVRERTAQLEATNQELEAFAYSISHDLRAPLRAINSFSAILQEEYSDALDGVGMDYLNRVRASSLKMSQLIDDLLDLSRLGRGELLLMPTNLTPSAKRLFSEITKNESGRKFDFQMMDLPLIQVDVKLMEVMLTNLLINAVKFTRGREPATIEFGYLPEEETPTFYIRDNGVGFEMKYADKLFAPFQRLHTEEEFEGTGIGLAIVQRVVKRHGGRIWIEAELDKGTTVFFTLQA